jgi:hypothetical protein
MSDYITKDNGTRLEYSTGAMKEQPSGKGRYDLIPENPLERLAKLYERGALKYGDYNWARGIPLSRLFDSMIRHAFQAKSGMTDEDHIIAVAWNAFAIAWTQAEIAAGRLPKELIDIPSWTIEEK